MSDGASGRGPGKWRLDETNRFAEELGSGREPRIEDHLERAEGTLRPELLRELVDAEASHRRENGEEIDPEEYAERFPELPPAEVEQLVSGSQSKPGASGSAYEVSGSAREASGSARAASGSAQAASGSARAASGSARAVSSPPTSFPLGETPRPGDAQTLPPPGDLPDVAAIGRYRVVRLIGRGTFGEVYEAVDPELERKVALKLPRAGRSLPPAEIERFRAEGRLLARLRHPGLVGVFDAGVTSDGRPFVVSELVDGEDLSARLKRERKLPAVEAARLIAEAAEALSVAHAAGVVHRDVKPANLLVDHEGTVRVADFGIALPEDRLEDARGEVLGSPGYMAPEQFTGDSHLLDGRADIWALGVVLTELLTGRRAFPAQTFDGLKEEVLHREPRPLRQLNPKLPHWLDGIVAKCLAKRPADRYETAADLAADLRRGMAGDLRPTGARRRRVIVATLAGSALAMTAAVMIGASSGLLTWPFGRGSDQREIPPAVTERTEVASAITLEEPIVKPAPEARETTETEADVVTSEPSAGVVQSEVTTAEPGNAVRSDLPAVEAPRPKALAIWLPEGTRPASGAGYVRMSVLGDRVAWDRIVKTAENATGSPIDVTFRLIPQERLNDPPAFYVMETKVWNELFGAFAAAEPSAFVDPKWDEGADARGRRLGVTGEASRSPVVKVRLREALRFAEWLGGRLPTAAEWDKAAGLQDHDSEAIGPFRQPTGGEAPDVAVGRKDAGPMAVGSAGDDVSRYGVRDVAGNGWELTRTIYGSGSELPGLSDLPPLAADEGESRIVVALRGRSFGQQGPLRFDAWAFTYQLDGDAHPWTSFRVVLEQE